MIELLQNIVSAITSLFNIIIGAIRGLVTLIAYIPSYISYLFSYVSFMPAILQTFILASVSVWLIYFILGREH